MPVQQGTVGTTAAIVGDDFCIPELPVAVLDYSNNPNAASMKIIAMSHGQIVFF
jgi:hypothetical protein